MAQRGTEGKGRLSDQAKMHRIIACLICPN
jgi:hypothetical protein